MKPSHAPLLALALTALFFTPAALADRGQHSQTRSGIVIYLSSGHAHYSHSARPWQYQRHHGHSYRQGYRDGYRAGRQAPKRHHHKKPHWRPGHVHAGPPGHARHWR